VATLQSPTPSPMSRVRDRVSPSEPNTGAASMYTMMNPVMSEPSSVSESCSSECFMLSASAATIHLSR